MLSVSEKILNKTIAIKKNHKTLFYINYNILRFKIIFPNLVLL